MERQIQIALATFGTSVNTLMTLLCRMQEVSTGWQESKFLQNNVGALSAEVKDLLDNILVIDPCQRITVEGIMQHPWYNQKLPHAYEAALQDLDRQQSELVRHVERQQYDSVGLKFELRTPLCFLRTGRGLG